MCAGGDPKGRELSCRPAAFVDENPSFVVVVEEVEKDEVVF